MKLRFLLFFPISAFCFGSLEKSKDAVDGREAFVHSRNGSVISRKFLNFEGRAIIQHLYFKDKEVFVIANDSAVNNVYHKMVGDEGIEIMEYEVDSQKKLTIGNPSEGKMEVFVYLEDGFVEPVSDEELSQHGYIHINGECIVLPNEK